MPSLACCGFGWRVMAIGFIVQTHAEGDMTAARFENGNTARRAVYGVAVIGVVVVLAIAAAGAAWFWWSGQRAYGVEEALRDCTQAIMRKTTHPDVARVPQVDARQSPTHYYLRWHLDKRLRLQNAFEVMVDVTGECVIDKKTQRVVTLYVDGQSWGE
jgi:hypothetical protein